MEIPAALPERLNSSWHLSLEKVVNGFYVLQMITSGTGAEEFLRSAVLPCSQGEAFILWKFDYRMGQVKAGLS